MQGLEGRILKRRYRVEYRVGRGGMAEVYQAWDAQRGHAVAIKVILEDLAEDVEFLQRFQGEGEALAALAHDHIVRFYSLERDGPLAFIVMNYVTGGTLQRRIRDAGNAPLPLPEVLSITQQVASALVYAHTKGVLHRDIKPGNIMIRPDGHALVTDFGIAKAADSPTVTVHTPGTPAYMSPEQCRGLPLDPRSDLYSLAVIVYELLAGRRPFVGDRAPTGGSARERVRWEQVNVAPLPLRTFNPAVPPALEEVVLAALAKDPAGRPPDAEAFWNAIRWATPDIPLEYRPADEGSEGAPEDEPAPSPAAGFRLPALPPAAWVIGGSLLAVVILLLVLVAGGTGGPVRPTPPSTRLPTTASVDTIKVGYHPVGRAMGAQVSCAGRPFGTVQIRLEGVEVLTSGELQFHMVYLWHVSSSERASCPEFKITIGSDAQNTNMYLTDELGNRYDHVRVGGAAAREKTMEPNVAQEGWFLFPTPRPGAHIFAFRDDDNGMAIVDIDLGR